MGGQLLSTYEESSIVHLDIAEAIVLKKCIDSLYRTYSGRIGNLKSTLNYLKTTTYPPADLQEKILQVELGIAEMEAIRVRLKTLSNKLEVAKV